MRYSVIVAALTLGVATVGGGCGAPDVPAGVDCADVISAGSSGGDLTAALNRAQSGDCVVLRDELYRGAFSVGAGVHLVGEPGAKAEIRGASEDAAAITLAGEAGAGIWGVTINQALGNGLVIIGSAATVQDVTITGAATAALAIRCNDPACRDAGNVIALEDVELRDSDIGLWLDGANVSFVRGVVANNHATGLTGGQGVVALGGAFLAMEAVVVDGNDYGVLVDGENATASRLVNVQVVNNTQRGVWAQGLRGSDTDPALDISGEQTLLDGNGHTGLGAIDSVGIIFLHGQVSNTVAVPAVTSLGTTAQIGDGVGLFGNSGTTTLDNVTLSANERSQMLVDRGGVGIIFLHGQIDTPGTELGVVVQNGSAPVDVPSEYVSTTPNPLDISAEVFPLVSILP